MKKICATLAFIGSASFGLAQAAHALTYDVDRSFTCIECDFGTGFDSGTVDAISVTGTIETAGSGPAIGDTGAFITDFSLTFTNIFNPGFTWDLDSNAGAIIEVFDAALNPGTVNFNAGPTTLTVAGLADSAIVFRDSFTTWEFSFGPLRESTFYSDSMFFGQAQGIFDSTATFAVLGEVSGVPTPPIPLPAGGLLILSGLAGLGVLAQRRAKPAAS